MCSSIPVYRCCFPVSLISIGLPPSCQHSHGPHHVQVIAGLEAPAVELKPVTAAIAQPPQSPSQQPPQPASPAVAAPAFPAANAGSPAHPKKRVQIVVPIPSQKAAGPVAQGNASPGDHGPKMPPR